MGIHPRKSLFLTDQGGWVVAIKWASERRHRGLPLPLKSRRITHQQREGSSPNFLFLSSIGGAACSEYLECVYACSSCAESGPENTARRGEMFSIIVSSLPAARQARTHRRRTRLGCLSVDLVSRRCGMFLFRDRESSAGNSISTLIEVTMSDVRASVI